MKKTVLTALALALLATVLPGLAALGHPLVREAAAAGAETGSGDLFYTPQKVPVSDSAFSVRLLDGGEVVTMTMADYLAGAVAAEMPASFESEALKAQAVALRTYALYKSEVERGAHADADICSDPSCCAAWKSEAFLRERWGADFDEYAAKIRAAVADTDGLYLEYGGAPALAAFHASSPGATEDAAAVWSASVPYLVSVSSPESEENVPNLVSEAAVPLEDFAAAILAEYPDADLSGDASDWLSGAEYDKSGRLGSVKIGGVTVSGASLRSLFALRSTALTFAVTDDGIVFTSRGSGHGVGMSQYGANILAGDGYSYEEILAKYYPGTQLARLEA